MPFGGGSNNEARRAREEEQARQQRIREGTQRINSIFDGGTYGSGRVEQGATFDPNAPYFNADGSAWQPPAPQSMRPSDVFANIGQFQPAGGRAHDGQPERSQQSGQSAAERAFAEAVANGSIYSGTGQRDGFNDDFFRGIRDSYTDFAMPQLNRQFDDANRELTYSLSRGGILDSSMRGQQSGRLQSMFDLEQQSVRDQALGFENQARNSVEGARSDLIAMLNATGDAEGAANSALTQAQILTQPQPYSPIGQMFTDFTSGLGSQAARERAYAAGGARPRYNTGLFGGQSNVTVR